MSLTTYVAWEQINMQNTLYEVIIFIFRINE